MTSKPFRIFAIPAVATLFLASCSDGDNIAGKYRDPSKNSAEFMSDGTVIFMFGTQQVLWKWTTYNGSRLKFEPGQGIPCNPQAAVCDYHVAGNFLRVTNCEYAMTLTRL